MKENARGDVTEGCVNFKVNFNYKPSLRRVLNNRTGNSEWTEDGPSDERNEWLADSAGCTTATVPPPILRSLYISELNTQCLL